jgi:hypothetical protein
MIKQCNIISPKAHNSSKSKDIEMVEILENEFKSLV